MLFQASQFFLQSVIPGRPDEVIVVHIDFIDGMIIDASQNYIEFVDAEGGVKQLLADHTELIDEIDYYDNCPSATEDDTESVRNVDVAKNKEKNTESNQKSVRKTCVACKRGETPGGAHSCVDCGIAVHPFRGCSFKIGNEEGYGDIRICISCRAAGRAKLTAELSKQSKKKSDAKETGKQLNGKPKWQPMAKNVDVAKNMEKTGSVVNSSSDDETESNQKSVQNTCVACKRGDTPGGAHSCVNCGIAVHPFPGCSSSIGGEEGYGELRICISCKAAEHAKLTGELSKQNKKKSDAKETAKQLNEKEKWQRKPKSKGSYLSSVPAWNIDRKVQSKPSTQPKFLINGSLSTTSYSIERKQVAIRNTCASDSLCQVGTLFD